MGGEMKQLIARLRHAATVERRDNEGFKLDSYFVKQEDLKQLLDRLEKLEGVVKVAQDLDAYRYTNQWGCVNDNDLRRLRDALAALEDK